MSDIRPRVFTATSKAVGPKAQNLKNEVKEDTTNPNKEVKIPSLEAQAVGAQLEQQIMSDLTSQAGQTRDLGNRQGIQGVFSDFANIVPQGTNMMGTQTGLGAQQLPQETNFMGTETGLRFTPVIGAQSILTQEQPVQTVAQEITGQTTNMPMETIVEERTNVPMQNIPVETIVEERTNVPMQNIPTETIVEERTNAMQNIPITETVTEPIGGTTVQPGGFNAFNQPGQTGVTGLTSSSQGLPIDQVIRLKMQEGEQMVQQDMQNLQNRSQ